MRIDPLTQTECLLSDTLGCRIENGCTRFVACDNQIQKKVAFKSRKNGKAKFVDIKRRKTFIDMIVVHGYGVVHRHKALIVVVIVIVGSFFHQSLHRIIKCVW